MIVKSTKSVLVKLFSSKFPNYKFRKRFFVSLMSFTSYEPAPVDFDDLARELVEILRIESDLSYNKCQNFAEMVLSLVQERLQLNALLPVMEALQKDIIDVPNCLDSKRMRQCFENVSECCADSQQRSWTLFEDEGSILSNLKTLDSLLINSDNRVSRFVLSEDDCRPLHDLVKFYQMETRISIRIALLKTLRLICLLSPELVSILLTTVLPCELAQDINNERQMTRKSFKFPLSLELLSILFCTGEQIPFTCYDVLHEEFLRVVLDIVETFEDDNDDKTVSYAMNVLLSFNLHPAGRDMVMNLLENADRTKIFAERLLLLANRREDPVWPYKDIETPYVSSVLNMLIVVLSSSKSSKIFYSNDLVVLVDIVLREIRDLSPGKRRTKFLHVLLSLARNPNFLDSRLNETKLVLQHFQMNTDDVVDEDLLLLDEINKLLI